MELVIPKEAALLVAADLKKFNEFLNKEPEKEWIKSNYGAKYIPIRIIENLLRSYFGVFQVEMIGQPQVLVNSISVSVHLKVYHPFLQQWIAYAGTGAVPIQLKADKKDNKGQVIEKGALHSLDFEKAIATGMHKNQPAALSFAVSNAAKKIGRVFGSDINNDETTEMYDVYSINNRPTEEHNRIKGFIDKSKTIQELEEHRQFCTTEELKDIFMQKLSEL